MRIQSKVVTPRSSFRGSRSVLLLFHMAVGQVISRRRLGMVYVVTIVCALALLDVNSETAHADTIEMAHDLELSIPWLVDRGVSLASIDLTGDCMLTVEDLAMAIAMRIDARPDSVGDRDGDGLITAVDTQLLIASVIRASMGDVTGSGMASEDDMIAIVNAIGASGDNIIEDVDGSGTVDALDVGFVIERMGELVPLDLVDALAWNLYPLVVEYDAMLRAGQISPETCGHANSNWPNGDHFEGVSQYYPPSHGNLVSSRIYPPNHMYSITTGWFPCPYGCHSQISSRDEGWPANHSYMISKDWTRQYPPGHGFINSSQQDNLPAVRHTLALSSQWPPNHTRGISGSYPGSHAVEVSAIWPPNHHVTLSDDHIWPDPSSHYQSISDAWDHSQLSSASWPPSHMSPASNTWQPGHVITTSVGWPGSHSSFVSASWPPNTYPGTWPPNHHGGVSASWGNPPPIPPGLFPPGHAYIPSGLYIIPFLNQ